MSRTKGFVTLATGNIHYYEVAANLLASYRLQTKNPLPFAIIAEEENEYTKKFDNTIIIKHPSRSYLDKIRLLECVPYDENIFLDADCLVYKDINYLWCYFTEKVGVFSAIGETLPLDSDGGWFKKEDVGNYKNQIAYIAHLHGGMYFIRKNNDRASDFLKTCNEIIENYQDFTFRMFNDPADEPVFALAMAIHDLPMISYRPDIMCFYPSTTSFSADIRIQKAVFEVPWNKGIIEGSIVHWGNFNTKKALYLRETARIFISFSIWDNMFVNSKYLMMKFLEDIQEKIHSIKEMIIKQN